MRVGWVWCMLLALESLNVNYNKSPESRMCVFLRWLGGRGMRTLCRRALRTFCENALVSCECVGNGDQTTEFVCVRNPFLISCLVLPGSSCWLAYIRATEAQQQTERNGERTSSVGLCGTIRNLNCLPAGLWTPARVCGFQNYCDGHKSPGAY